jgi:hypothetical protein
MSADQYLQRILERESVDTRLFSPVRNVQTQLGPIIQEWAGDKLVSVSPSGSFASGREPAANYTWNKLENSLLNREVYL